MHLLLAAFVALTPDVPLPIQETPEIQANLKTAVHLTAPRIYEPTQRDPNKGKVVRGLDLRSAVEGQPARRFRPPTPAPGPPAPSQPSISSLDAPKIDVASGAPLPPLSGAGAPALGPPPASRPKLALEGITGGSSPKPNPNPANATAKLELPKPAFALPRPPGGGTTVGDIGELAPAISGAPIQTPCQECSTLQLLSDPQNVDFKPYLQQVLAMVKRNWLSVIPESAKLGRRGQVLLQFSIDRRGLVPKVVIASPSGVEAFDRAAVAGLSMSNPLPPLPAEYKGDQVRLQMAFSYNIGPRR
ncbi:MAG TPA: energy transducer TonB [Bryobacteraceae bacterium]|nr:energy transducer TonB [Bryobacteraceae bacterium]